MVNSSNSINLVNRIIPGRGPAWVDNLCLAVYFTIICALAPWFLYFNWEDEACCEQLSKSDLFSAIASDIIIPLQLVLTLPAMTFLMKNSKDFVFEEKLPKQQRPLLFLAVVTSQIVFTVLNIVLTEPPYREGYKMLFLIGFGIVFSFVRLVSTFLIGAIGSYLGDKLDRAYSVGNLDHVMTDFTRFKNGVEPLIFLVFSSQTILLNITIYQTITGYLPYAILACNEMLEMAYIVYVLDDVYMSLKSLLIDLQSGDIKNWKRLISCIQVKAGQILDFLPCQEAFFKSE